MVEIDVPSTASTKNFHKYVLNNGKYIVSVYLAKLEFPTAPKSVKVMVEL